MDYIGDYIGYIVLIVLCVIAVIGLIIGFGKGFMEMSSWANEYVIATAGALLIGVFAGDMLTDYSWLGFVVVLGAGIVLMLVFMLISAAFRKGFAKGVSSHRRKLGYVNMEAQKEADEGIVEALSRKDFRAYKKMTKASKKKFKQHRGGWGVIDRLFGAITGAIKYFVVAALIITACLVVLDLAGIAQDGVAITETYLYSIYKTDIWTMVQPYIMDFFLMGAVCACIRKGYKSGLFSALWVLLALCLVGGGFYLAWVIVSSSGTFDGMAASLAGLIGMGESDMGTLIAQIILTAGLGIIFAIVIILLAIFIPRAIDAARETKTFHLVDGILGSIIVTVIVVGILMFLFGMLSTLTGLEHEPEIFVKIGTYFKGGVGRYFYADNFLTTFDWFPNLAEYLG